LALGHQCSCYFKKIKHISAFQKNHKKNHGVANELSNKRTQFQFQIQNIPSYTKMTKRVDLGMHILNLQISRDFAFLV
jgi:hypothetical protein